MLFSFRKIKTGCRTNRVNMDTCGNSYYRGWLIYAGGKNIAARIDREVNLEISGSTAVVIE